MSLARPIPRIQLVRGRTLVLDARRARRVAWVRLASLTLTALSMTAGFAHLLALPNKIHLARDAYFAVQQIYRGWALLGLLPIGALVTATWSAVLLRRSSEEFVPTVVAATSLLLSLLVFFAFTFPANLATRNWTFAPSNWEALRRQWEYSHAAGALLHLVALVSLALALTAGQRRRLSP